MINPNVMEAWFSLMAEAMKGTKEAQDAFQLLSTMTGDPEGTRRWMARFMPAAMASTGSLQPDAFEEWMEESWRMMGVVPRSRYLELLEKCDKLQRQLNQAEETVQNLRSRLDTRGQQEEEAKKMVDMWSSMLDDTLKAQTEWMRSWTEANQQTDSSDKQEEGQPTDTEGDRNP